MGWADRYFQTASSDHIFFPNSCFSKGYVVNDTKKTELVALVSRRDGFAFLISLTAAIIGGWFFGEYGFWGGVLLAVLPLGLYYRIGMRRLLAGVPRTEHRRTLAEQLRATAIALPATAVYAMLFLFLIGTVGDAFFVYEHMKDGDYYGLSYASAEFAVFAVMLFVIVRVVQFRRRQA